MMMALTFQSFVFLRSVTLRIHKWINHSWITSVQSTILQDGE